MLKPTTSFVIIDRHGDTWGEPSPPYADSFETFDAALATARFVAGRFPTAAPFSVRVRSETPLQQIYARGPSYNPVASEDVLPAISKVAA